MVPRPVLSVVEVKMLEPDSNVLLEQRVLCLHAVTVQGLQEGFLSTWKSQNPPAEPHRGETLHVSALGMWEDFQQLKWQS